MIIYISRTTGAPKGVMLDHANLAAMAMMGSEAPQVGPANRCLLIRPLFHVNGIVVSVLRTLLAGGSVVIADCFNPHTFSISWSSSGPTFFSAVPTVYTMLAALPVEIEPDTASLRFAICGATPASAELPTRSEDRYRFPLIEGCGLSEGTCASTINPVAGPRRARTVGLQFPGAGGPHRRTSPASNCRAFATGKSPASGTQCQPTMSGASAAMAISPWWADRRT